MNVEAMSVLMILLNIYRKEALCVGKFYIKKDTIINKNKNGVPIDCFVRSYYMPSMPAVLSFSDKEFSEEITEHS